MAEKEKSDLNIKQLKFIDNIFEGMTQYEAYTKAGYEATNNHIARANASRLIANDNIQEEITRRLEELKAKNRLRLYRISESALNKLDIILQTNEDMNPKKPVKNTYLIGIKANIIKDILDRVGLKLAEEHNVNVKGELNVTNAREKLISKLDSLASKRTKN
jgi:phage terminase small subunit